MSLPIQCKHGGVQKWCPECTKGKWTEWVSPKMKGYRMTCCDCGLIHEIEFDIVKFTGEEKGDLSKCVAVKDKDIQVIFRMRRRGK